jgi:hypothetical protein
MLSQPSTTYTYPKGVCTAGARSSAAFVAVGTPPCKIEMNLDDGAGLDTPFTLEVKLESQNNRISGLGGVGCLGLMDSGFASWPAHCE